MPVSSWLWFIHIYSAVAKLRFLPKSSTCCANPDQASYILFNPQDTEEDKYHSSFFKNILTLPGTHWMRFATMALKWALISLRISASLSFSASKCIRIRSTYSRNRAPMARLSRSRAPFVLHRDMENRQDSCVLSIHVNIKIQTNRWSSESIM